METSPKALLTGATGFIGSHLVKRLLREGWKVDVLLREHSSMENLAAVADKITVHRINGSTESISNAMAAAKPDTVFHLASLFIAEHKSTEVVPLIQSNVQFSTQLVEAMTQHGVSKLINTGTAWQHYKNSAYDPVCLYAATKQAFEILLDFYLNTTPLRAITLKLFDTYGPEDKRPKLFAALQRASEAGITLEMSGGDQLIDIVHIEDVLTAFMQAAELLKDAPAGTHSRYAISSGKPLTLRNLVETYGRICGKTLSAEWGKRPYRKREVMIPWNNGESLPGWNPKISLEDGIRELIASK